MSPTQCSSCHGAGCTQPWDVLLLYTSNLQKTQIKGKTEGGRWLICAGDGSVGEQGGLDVPPKGNGLANGLLHCSVPQFPLHQQRCCESWLQLASPAPEEL